MAPVSVLWAEPPSSLPWAVGGPRPGLPVSTFAPALCPARQPGARCCSHQRRRVTPVGKMEDVPEGPFTWPSSGHPPALHTLPLARWTLEHTGPRLVRRPGVLSLLRLTLVLPGSEGPALGGPGPAQGGGL